MNAITSDLRHRREPELDSLVMHGRWAPARGVKAIKVSPQSNHACLRPGRSVHVRPARWGCDRSVRVWRQFEGRMDGLAESARLRHTPVQR